MKLFVQFPKYNQIQRFYFVITDLEREFLFYFSIVLVFMIRNLDIKMKEQKVTQFKVKVSMDETTWISVDGGRLFTAIPEKDEKIHSYFLKAYHSRYIRVYPMSRGNGAFAFRLGWIRGCEKSNSFAW